MLTIVLLNVDWIWAMPNMSTFFVFFFDLWGWANFEPPCLLDSR
jgi:hypothetical protein